MSDVIETGQADDNPAAPSDDVPAGEAPAGTPDGGARRRALLMLVLAAVLAVVALALWVLSPELADDQNVAVVDGEQTAELVDVVTQGMEASFAYDFRHPERAPKAAEDFLTGDAAKEYADLYGAIADVGPEQSLVYESTVTQIGVQTLVGDTAEVLVFAEQVSTRGTDGAVEEAPAQLRLSLERVDGTWRVSSIELL